MCPPFNLSAPGGAQGGEGWAALRPGPRQGKGGGTGTAARLFMETPAQLEPAMGTQEALSPPGLGAVPVSILNSQGDQLGSGVILL